MAVNVPSVDRVVHLRCDPSADTVATCAAAVSAAVHASRPLVLRRRELGGVGEVLDPNAALAAVLVDSTLLEAVVADHMHVVFEVSGSDDGSSTSTSAVSDDGSSTSSAASDDGSSSAASDDDQSLASSASSAPAPASVDHHDLSLDDHHQVDNNNNAASYYSPATLHSGWLWARPVVFGGRWSRSQYWVLDDSPYLWRAPRSAAAGAPAVWGYVHRETARPPIRP